MAVSVNADLSACDGDPTCTWSFGDGANATGCKSKEHNYGQPGNYTVTMAMECGQASQSSTRQVKVKANHSWQTGDWSPTQGCGDTEQTRSVECVSDYDGSVDEDGSECNDPNPDATRVVELDNACEPICYYESGNPERRVVANTRSGYKTELTLIWNDNQICSKTVRDENWPFFLIVCQYCI